MKALSFDDITLVPNYSDLKSRKDVDTSVKFGNLTLKIPILSAAMDTITGHAMARKIYELGGLGFLHRFCSIEDNVKMYQDAILEWQNTSLPRKQTHEAVVSLGINEGMDRFHALYEVNARFFSIDVAHSHSKQVGKFIKQLKEFDESITLVAGSVCTYAGADYLSSCGADIIRVGVSPGSVCTTRVKTGFGLPMFQTILDCSKVNKPIIADGGIRNGGDIIKSLIAGASYVMLGGVLAGHSETPGELMSGLELRSGYKIGMCPPIDQYKIFRGMSSKEAQEDFGGPMLDYKAAEGVEIKVPFKGPVENTIKDLIGGIRSGMCYAGCSRLEELHRKVEWREITVAGHDEGLPHGEGRL